MLDPGHQNRIGGTSSRISDCYIWAEIHYLDSSTAYREYLPQCGPVVARPDNKLVMLDDEHPTWLLGVLRNLITYCLVLVVCVVLILWGWWAY